MVGTTLMRSDLVSVNVPTCLRNGARLRRGAGLFYVALLVLANVVAAKSRACFFALTTLLISTR